MSEPTVSEIAARTPAAVRVFEKYRIDYCCGGERPLAEACRERGLSVEAVLAEVGRSGANGGATDWSRLSLAELIGHIVSTHHEYLKSELPLLSRRLAKVVEVHGHKYPQSLPPLQEVFEGLQQELEAHLRKEELILFPAIEQLEADGAEAVFMPFGSIRNPIGMMMHEHDSAGAALADMRRLTQDFTLPPDACATYRALFDGLKQLEADLHQHIHLENNILFPRAAEL